MTVKEYFTVAEIAEEMRVTPKTIRLAIRAKKLGASRINSMYRVSREQYKAWLSSIAVSMDDDQ